MKLNWNFLGVEGGGGCKTKNLLWGEYNWIFSGNAHICFAAILNRVIVKEIGNFT